MTTAERIEAIKVLTQLIGEAKSPVFDPQVLDRANAAILRMLQDITNSK